MSAKFIRMKVIDVPFMGHCGGIRQLVSHTWGIVVVSANWCPIHVTLWWYPPIGVPYMGHCGGIRQLVSHTWGIVVESVHWCPIHGALWWNPSISGSNAG